MKKLFLAVLVFGLVTVASAAFEVDYGSGGQRFVNRYQVDTFDNGCGVPGYYQVFRNQYQNDSWCVPGQRQVARQPVAYANPYIAAFEQRDRGNGCRKSAGGANCVTCHQERLASPPQQECGCGKHHRDHAVAKVPSPQHPAQTAPAPSPSVEQKPKPPVWPWAYPLAISPINSQANAFSVAMLSYWGDEPKTSVFVVYEDNEIVLQETLVVLKGAIGRRVPLKFEVEQGRVMKVTDKVGDSWPHRPVPPSPPPSTNSAPASSSPPPQPPARTYTAPSVSTPP